MHKSAAWFKYCTNMQPKWKFAHKFSKIACSQNDNLHKYAARNFCAQLWSLNQNMHKYVERMEICTNMRISNLCFFKFSLILIFFKCSKILCCDHLQIHGIPKCCPFRSILNSFWVNANLYFFKFSKMFEIYEMFVHLALSLTVAKMSANLWGFLFSKILLQ